MYPAIQHNINARQYVVIDDPEIRKVIVSIDGMLLKEMSIVDKSMNVCSTAVKQNPRAIEWVPFYFMPFL